MAGLTDFLTAQHVLVFSLIAVAIYFAFFYNKNEGLENVEVKVEAPKEVKEPEVAVPKEEKKLDLDGTNYGCLDNVPNFSCGEFQAGEGTLIAEDLLPKYDEENEFAKQNPVGELLKEKNFLISGYHLGINTVMQSNKIPYYDIRSLPPIPKESVGPWSQSSYEKSPSNQRRGFEIGV